MRFDRIDNFWFTLRHECSHVLQWARERGSSRRSGPRRDRSLMTNEKRSESPTRKPPTFCSTEPQASMDSFYMRKHPFFSELDVLAFFENPKGGSGSRCWSTSNQARSAATSCAFGNMCGAGLASRLGAFVALLGVFVHRSDKCTRCFDVQNSEQSVRPFCTGSSTCALGEVLPTS